MAHLDLTVSEKTVVNLHAGTACTNGNYACRIGGLTVHMEGVLRLRESYLLRKLDVSAEISRQTRASWMRVVFGIRPTAVRPCDFLVDVSA